MTIIDAILRRLAAVEATPPGGISAINLSAGTTSQNLSKVTFANSNGVSFGLSGSVITASAAGAAGGVAMAAGTQTATSGTVGFGNANGVTFGMAGSSQITASHNGLTSQSNQAVSAANGSATFQTLSFANSNGLSFSTGTQGLFGSYTVPSTAGLLSALPTEAGGATQSVASLKFSDAGGVTFGFDGASILTAKVNADLISAINVSAGTTSRNLSAVTFGNGGNVSFGLNGSVVTASAPSGGAGPTVSMYPALPHAWATSSMYTGASTTVVGGSQSTLSYYIAPLILPNAVTFNDVGVIIQPAATVAGTGSGTHRHIIGIYTRDVSTLNKVTDFAWNAVHSQNSVTAQTLSWWNGSFAGSSLATTQRISGNVSASITGARLIPLNATSVATSLSAGEYYIAHAYNFRSSSSALFNMGTAWRYSVSQFTGAIGFSNTTKPFYNELNGIVSTVSSTPTQFEFVAPASIHISNISATGGTSRNQWPLVVLKSVTA